MGHQSQLYIAQRMNDLSGTTQVYGLDRISALGEEGLTVCTNGKGS
jgi:hypothetical protein